MVQAINLAIVPNISLGQTRVGEVSMWKGCALANAGRNAVFAALLAKEGMTIVAVTHEMQFARNVADRVMIMDDGQWVEQGPPDEIFTNPEEERTRQFLAHVL